MARRRSRRSQRQPLDRLALIVITGLALAMGLLIFSGDHATARVREFSWQDRQVGAEDQAFLIVFSRPMDPPSVEENLVIDPPLPGKVSWAGRRMAYTVTEPIPYGESFSVSLPAARDRFSTDPNQAEQFQSFQGQFQTRQRAFLYIGAEGDEAGRLVLAELAQQKRLILTPPDLAVLSFEPYPLGDRVLFSASDRSQGDGLLSQQLYTVTTGVNPRPPVDFITAPPPFWQRLWPKPADLPSGDVSLALDNRDYQNLKFDLSPNGQTIVVQRVSKQDPADYGPWVLRQGQSPYPLKTEPGGDFLIAPDSQSLVLLQGEGTAIIDLSAEDQKKNRHQPVQPLDFLPNYGQVLDIATDGSAAAMVNFNQDDPAKRFTESLFLVTNQGLEEELLRVTGAIIDAKFDPTRRFIYVMASELATRDPADDIIANSGSTYVEQPVLVAINLDGGDITKLLLLPQEQRLEMSLAPDGLALLLNLDGEMADSTAPSDRPAMGPAIWYLPLFTDPADRRQGQPAILDPDPFPFKGLQATWLP